MRRRSLFFIASLVAACAAPERPTAIAPDGAPRLVQNAVDTVGLPDLIVDSKATQNKWVVRDEDLPANFCSVQEGGVTPGVHTIVRFTVTTPNIGNADVFLGNPLDHVAKGDSLYEFATCHQHYHFKHYATYRLIDSQGHEWKAAKRGFCMLDTDPYNAGTGDGTWNYRSCGTTTLSGFQGVSNGWADTYVWKLGGQYFVLDGGDGQPPVPPGVYTIRVEVNPAYDPDPVTGKCPRATDPATGKCHQIAESNYTNNVGEATILIPANPGKAGYGPLKNGGSVTAADDIDNIGQ